MVAAHTAVNISELTAEEKEIIRYVNLARMYPRKFAELEVKNYLGPKEFGDYLKTSTYKKSLLEDLKNRSPVAPLHFDERMYVLAKCFAREMGIRNYTGHRRKDCSSEGLMGECCNYGDSMGRDIAIGLLIDHDVPSLGHREICLSGRYRGIGVSIAPHKSYRYGAVLDFR